MSDAFQKEIDERTNLSGTNKFELLLFKLGSVAGTSDAPMFGINVFKIREIVPIPRIVKAIGTQSPVLGVINLRGQIIPVIDLPAALGCRPRGGLNILMITEYARSVQAFAVESVEEIARLDWSQVMSAEQEAGAEMITSIARLELGNGDSQLVQVLDVEQILGAYLPKPASAPIPVLSGNSLRHLLRPGAIILAADDSKVARVLIEHSLQSLDLPCQITTTGKQAWLRLQALAQQARQEGVDIRDKVGLLLTDIEMPEMDGFTLTRQVKTDPLLAVLPVLIHSSLSGSSNEEHIKNAGADGYVTKFANDDLAQSLTQVLQGPVRNWRASAPMLEGALA